MVAFQLIIVLFISTQVNTINVSQNRDVAQHRTTELIYVSQVMFQSNKFYPDGWEPQSRQKDLGLPKILLIYISVVRRFWCRHLAQDGCEVPAMLRVIPSQKQPLLLTYPLADLSITIDSGRCPAHFLPGPIMQRDHFCYPQPTFLALHSTNTYNKVLQTIEKWQKLTLTFPLF